MFRRQFLQAITLSGAVALPALRKLTAQSRDRQHKTVTLDVKGFTCVTCAVGLETMLLQHKGVQAAKASYPRAHVVIEFEPGVVSETALTAFIAEMGFSVEEKAS